MRIDSTGPIHAEGLNRRNRTSARDGKKFEERRREIPPDPTAVQYCAVRVGSV
jgi:hypothetical protein